MAILTLRDSRVISYDEYGSGPVIMLLHSSPGTSKMWQRVGNQIAGRFRVIAPDLPGYGETTAQDISASPDVSYTVDLIEALISAIGSPPVLVGHSYGGVVALSSALQNPKKILGLGLLEPVAISILSAVGENESFADTKAVFDEYISSFEGGDNQAVRKMIDFWFGLGAFEKMPSPLKDYLLTNTALNIRDVRATFQLRYSIESFSSMDVPVLVIYGKKSPEVTRKIARTIAAHTKRGSLVGLENATHAMITTHVDEVSNLIVEFACQCVQTNSPGKPLPIVRP